MSSPTEDQKSSFIVGSQFTEIDIDRVLKFSDRIRTSPTEELVAPLPVITIGPGSMISRRLRSDPWIETLRRSHAFFSGVSNCERASAAPVNLNHSDFLFASDTRQTTFACRAVNSPIRASLEFECVDPKASSLTKYRPRCVLEPALVRSWRRLETFRTYEIAIVFLAIANTSDTNRWENLTICYVPAHISSPIARSDFSPARCRRVFICLFVMNSGGRHWQYRPATYGYTIQLDLRYPPWDAHFDASAPPKRILRWDEQRVPCSPGTIGRKLINRG